MPDRNLPLYSQSIPGTNIEVSNLDNVFEMVRPTMLEIRAVVADYYGVKLAQMEGRERMAHVALARHVYCYFCFKLNGASYGSIGQRIGGRDHATVRHGIHRVEAMRMDMPLMADQLDAIKMRIARKVLQRGEPPN